MAEVTSAVIATSLVLISSVCPGQLLPRYNRHPVQAVLADHRFLHRHLGVQRAHPFTCAGRVFLRPETRPTGLLGLLLNPVEAESRALLPGMSVAVTWVVKWRYAFLVLFVAGLGATVYTYNTCPRRSSRWKTRLLHDPGADAARRVARLHH